MAGLNEKIKMPRERVDSTATEKDALRSVCIELQVVRDEHVPDDNATRFTDLQEQLTRFTATEEANLVKIQLRYMPGLYPEARAPL